MSQLNAFDQHDPNYPAVRQLIFDHFHGETDIDVTVAQNDDMFSYSCFHCGGRPIGSMAYFRAGLSIFDCVADIAKSSFGGLANVGSFLDFAAGHGRFTRVLAGVHPKSQIWAAEIIPDAVRFHAQVLKINSIQSTPTPEDFRPSRSFDFIFVASLFTHLPNRTFTGWLKRLFELLTPNGILVFTTHGPEHMKPEDTMPPEGMLFVPSSEIPSLSTEDYGAAIVTPAFVRRVIGNVTGREECWYQHRALGSQQDLWIIGHNRLPLENFQYDSGPQGHVDHAYWHGPLDLSIQCWAACIHNDHKISTIRVLLNGEECGSLDVNYDRPDIADYLRNPHKSWAGARGTVRTPRPLQPWTDVLSFIAVCSGGKEFSLRTGGACTFLQFGAEATPVDLNKRFSPTSLTMRGKLHRVLDYALDGDWRLLSRKSLDFFRGR